MVGDARGQYCKLSLFVVFFSLVPFNVVKLNISFENCLIVSLGSVLVNWIVSLRSV